eukprot:1839057-Pleurochrysis_carterae.AAC.2
MSLRAALDAKASFQRAIPLALIYSDKSHERTSRWQLRSVDERPAAVGFVVVDLSAFGGRPA